MISQLYLEYSAKRRPQFSGLLFNRDVLWRLGNSFSISSSIDCFPIRCDRHGFHQFSPERIGILLFRIIEMLQYIHECRLDLFLAEGRSFTLYCASIAMVAIPDVIAGATPAAAPSDFMAEEAPQSAQTRRYVAASTRKNCFAELTIGDIIILSYIYIRNNWLS